MSTNQNVHYTQFNPENLVAERPEQKTNQAGGKYMSLKLRYKYAPGVVKPFYLEGPEMKTPGIFRNENKDGKITWSLMLPFLPEDPKAMEFQSVIEKMYERIIDIAVEWNNVLKIVLDNPKDKTPVEMLRRFIAQQIPSPLRYKKDKEGNEQMDAPRLMYAGFLDYEPKEGESRGTKTIIANFEGEEVDWESLLNSSLTAIPCLFVDSIYIATVKTIKTRLSSAILTDPPQPRSNTTFRQNATLQRVHEERKDDVDKIRAGWAQFNAARGHVIAQQTAMKEGEGLYEPENGYGQESGVDPSLLVQKLGTLETADAEVERFE